MPISNKGRYSLNKVDKTDEFYIQHIKPYEIISEDNQYLSSPYYQYYWINDISTDWDWQIVSKDSSSLKSRGWVFYLLEQMDHRFPKKLRDALISGELQFNYPTYYSEMPEQSFLKFDSVLSLYGKTISDDRIYAHAKTEINLIELQRSSTQRGLKAPEFSLIDSNSKKYTLANFKGKVIYMDVWASWCGPCIYEIPELKKLINDYKEKPELIFITVSIDKTAKDWIQIGINRHNPPGLQLWAQGGWSSKFAKSYFLSHIPKYIIIDKFGKIANFNAFSPGDKRIREELDAVLGQK